MVKESKYKKEWIGVVSSSFITNKIFAETIVEKDRIIKEDSSGLINKSFSINAMDLNPDLQTDCTKIKLKASDIENGFLKTSFNGIETTRDKISSIIRKWHTLIETHVDIRTTDNFFLRVFVVCHSKKEKNQLKRFSYLKSSQKRGIIRITKEILIKEGIKSNTKEFLNKILSGYVSDLIQEAGSKIHSINNVIIKKIKVL